MPALSPAERELAELLLTALQLEDRSVDSIDPAAPLFGGEPGWGLDSIDALEIALAVQRRYGIELRTDDEASHKAMASLRSLSAHVEGHRAK